MYLKSRDSDAFDEATGGGTQASNYIYTQIVLVLGGGDTVTSRPCPSPSPSLVPTEIGRGGEGGKRPRPERRELPVFLFSCGVCATEVQS